jgi:ferredoxin
LPKVTFVNEQITVEAQPGQTLLDVAEKSGINVFRGIWQGLHCSSGGWCNRCKVWATPLEGGALNAKTSSELSGFRLGGRIPKHGTLRLACQAKISGDVEVRTRSGFEKAPTVEWQPDPRPFKWRERWEKRNEEDEEKPAKKAAPAKVAAATGGDSSEG